MLRVDPHPVPYSGQRIEIFACRDLQHTWFYDQILHNNTGRPITFTERDNFFDNILVSRTRETINLEPNGTVVLRTRWCSGHPRAHITQHRYRGTDPDGNPLVLNGPVVQLLAR